MDEARTREAKPRGAPAPQRGRGARATRSGHTPEARTSALVARLKALADPTRLRMLELLARNDTPICVCEITSQFALHQPTISHHLRLLREAGLVDCERRGVWAYYWATEAGKRSLASLASLG
jgi:ArsR family transcriptional regulator, arsenate/arsenite/antimonite-responsive transcriptional repressor